MAVPPYDPLRDHAAELARVALDVAEEIASRSNSAAPVDTGFLSGRDGRGGYRGRPTVDGAEVVSPAHYWKYVEYGTSRASAQPHVRPAIDETRVARS